MNEDNEQPGQHGRPILSELAEDFGRRGEEAWQHYLQTGRSLSAAEVLLRLEAKLDARRSELLQG